MKRDDPKLAIMNLYLMSRRILKQMKRMDSNRVMKHLILLHLSEQSHTIRELSDIFDVNHSFMSSRISAMEKEGVIKKGKSKEDTRYTNIIITTKGLTAVKVIKKFMDKYCKITFEKLTPKEIGVIASLAPKVRTDYHLPDLDV